MRAGALGRYPRPSRSWRRPVGEGNPVRKRARFPCGLADWRGAASSSVTAKGAGGSPRRTLRCRRRSDGGGGGGALAPVHVTCAPWVTPIAASTSRDVLLRIQPELFPAERGASCRSLGLGTSDRQGEMQLNEHSARQRSWRFSRGVPREQSCSSRVTAAPCHRLPSMLKNPLSSLSCAILKRVESQLSF